MSIMTCPNCNMKVVPGRDGQCPSCRTKLTDPVLADRSEKPEKDQGVERDSGVDSVASQVPCALCNAMEQTTNRVIRIGRASANVSSVSVQQLLEVEAPICDSCYGRGRRLQWLRMLAGFSVLPLMMGFIPSMALAGVFFGEGKQVGQAIVVVHLLIGIALIVWWLYWLFPFFRRKVSGLISNEALSRRLKRLVGVDEFGLLCGPSLHPVKPQKDYVPVQEVLALPLPPEEPVNETTRKGFLSGLSLQQKLIWLAVLIGLPILVLRTTYFSDEQIRLRRYNGEISRLLTIAEQLAKTIPSSDDFSPQRPDALASPTVSMENTMVFSVKSVIAPEYPADDRLPVDQYSFTSRGRMFPHDVPASYDWRPPGGSNDDDTDYGIFDFKAGLAQLERNEFVILVRFVDWIDPKSDRFRSVRAGRAVMDSFLFDTGQGTLVASQRLYVNQGNGYVENEKDARQQLVELVDTRVRDWMSGGYVAESESD